LKEGNKLIRIKFSKHGLMKYTGHLDTMRYFQKVVRRSGINAAYSEGFSPHQIMSFAQPLSVGVESNGEYFDLEVTGLSSASDMMERMNAVSAEGMEIRDIVLLPDKAKKAMATVHSAEYSVIFRPGHEPEWDIFEAVRVFKDLPSLKITKKSKKSVREIELKDFVYYLDIEERPLELLFPEGPLSGDVIEDPKKTVPFLHMRLSAASGDNVKPALLIRALRGIMDKDTDEEDGYPSLTDLLITRENLFDSDGKPLSDAGERF